MHSFQKNSGLEAAAPNQTNPPQDRPGRLGVRATAFLMNRRKRLVALLVILFTTVEIAEHLIILRYGNLFHIWFDLILYAVLLPLGLWVLMSLLETSASERDKLARDQNLRLEFSQKLSEATNWEELVCRIVEYSHQVAPEATATLFTFNTTTLRMDPEAACKCDGNVVIKPPRSINPDTLPVGSLPQLLLQNAANHTVPLSTLGAPPAPLPPNRYDLPVTRNDQVLGVIKLEFPLGSAPSQSQIRALQSAAPVIALALEVATLQKLAAEQAAASTTQRQQIAQNLHDTLAQNISYLRLKLDQLTGENAIHEIGSVLQELERMRSTADEAYQQVRNTLDELAPVQSEDLPVMILKQAHSIGSRSGFELHTSRIGVPYSLPAATRQQILYIVREALHNVEKHSRATEVRLQHCWLETEFILKINDNGVGFNPRSVTNDGHYGLWIMQHRAQEIGGTVKIVPTAGAGTEVTLWIPRPGCDPSSVN